MVNRGTPKGSSGSCAVRSYFGNAGTDALSDQRACEFGEYSEHLEQGTTRRRGRVDTLTLELEIDASDAQRLKYLDEVLE